MSWEKIIAQLVIGTIGNASLLLALRHNRWGIILGLIAQPFWYVAAWQDFQPGIMFSNVIATLMWVEAFLCDWLHIRLKLLRRAGKQPVPWDQFEQVLHSWNWYAHRGFGGALALKCMDLKLSIEDAADRCHLKDDRLRAIIAGSKPQKCEANKLRFAFGIDYNELLTDQAKLRFQTVA